MSRRQQRRRDDRRREAQRRRAAAGAGVALGVALAGPAASQAANFVVTSTANTGGNCDATPTNCTLPQAIASANTNGNPGSTDFIFFHSTVSGTVNLTSELTIAQDVYINGTGADRLEIHQTTPGLRVFDVTTHGEAGFFGMSITGGGDATTNGGGIYSMGARLYLSYDWVHGNHGHNGGGINEQGGYLLARGSTISGNSASGDGGGVYTYGDHAPAGAAYFQRSTLSGNTAVGKGGGLRSNRYAYEYDYLQKGAGGFFYDSTVAGNGAASGGGVSAYVDSEPRYYYKPGYGPYTYGGGPVDGPHFSNTIVADNTSTSGYHDLGLEGHINAAPLHFSLIESTSAGDVDVDEGGGSILYQDPQLLPLASNGWKVPTQAPRVTSPVIDHGKSYYTNDQRDRGRPVDLPTAANGAGDAADMGAVELQSTTDSQPVPSSGSTTPPPPGPGPPVFPPSQASPILTFPGTITTTGDAMTFTVNCGGAPCDADATLTTQEVLKGRKLVSVARKSKRKKKSVTVGSKHFSLAAGHSAAVTVPLNATGKKLLKRFHRLPTTLTVTQTLPGKGRVVIRTARVAFKPKAKKKKRRSSH